MVASARHCAYSLFAGPELADEDPPGLTPGISFATDTIPLGSFAWEMGLPDASWDESDGVRTTTWMADTLLRFGVIDALELQLDADSYGGIRQPEVGGAAARAAAAWTTIAPTGRMALHFASR